MRFIFFLFIFLVIIDGVGQNKPTYYNYFDNESNSNPYDYVESLLKEENITSGNIREVKVYSAGGRIDLHIKLNKKAQIVEFFQYDPNSSKLLRTKLFENKRALLETEYNLDGTKDYVKYSYDRSGRIISQTFSETNHKLKTEITSHYNTQGQVVSRQYRLRKGASKVEFQYEGDSVTWRIFSQGNRPPKGVMKRLWRPGYELITSYWLDTLSDAPFKQRIRKPNGSEFLTRWDNKGNIIEQSELDYDSIHNKSIRSIVKYEYNDKNLLVKSHSYYNTKLLSGEYSSENVYNDRGQIILEIRKNFKSGNLIKNEFGYDQYGNTILINNSKFFRYTFDKNGNWILKESLIKETPNDAWIVESRREIFYYK